MKRPEDTEPLIYNMPSEATGLDVIATLAGRYPSKREEHAPATVVYHDTFDWRLFRAGGLMTSAKKPRGVVLEWRPLKGRVEGRRWEIEAVPAFAWDFPEGALRRELAPILAMRRLLPIFVLESRRLTLHLLDDEEKTVVRVQLRFASVTGPDHDCDARLRENRAPEERNASRFTLPVRLRVIPLRGYRSEREELVRFLETEIGLQSSSEGDDFTAALSLLGRTPGDYTSKPRLLLDPSLRADEAAVEIYRALFAAMEKNEGGTRRDLDSEFLHDFRVAVRRTRSALSQLKEVFPAPVVDHFKREFSWLGSVTGPTRDLDVYLLKIGDYETSLPEKIRAALGPLRDFLIRHQKLEQKRLVSELDQDRYRDLSSAWRQFLSEPIEIAAANADRPVLELASERLWRAWRRVWKRGRVIGPETPAQALHDLRIDCKKLRYLLELFRSLYRSAEIDPLIKALKQLQDNLGDFNDFEVQQDKLRDFARQMEEERAASAETFLAMGELMAMLRRLQGEERLKFEGRFKLFTAPRNRKTFRRLFGPPRVELSEAKKWGRLEPGPQTET